MHTILPVPERKIGFGNSEDTSYGKGPARHASVVDVSDPAKPFLLLILPEPIPLHSRNRMSNPDTQIADLTRRLALLEDKEALRTTLVRGWRALDYKDWDGWIRYWTEDAQFDFGPWGVLDGKQAIRDKVVQSEEPYAAMMHQLLNMHFEVDGDRATGVGFMWFIGIADLDKPSEIISLGGPYDWEFRREPDGWRISGIVLSTWWQQGEDTTSAFS